MSSDDASLVEIPEHLRHPLEVVQVYSSDREARAEAMRSLSESGNRVVFDRLIRVIRRSWEEEGNHGYLEYRTEIAWTCFMIHGRIENAPPFFLGFPQFENEVEAQVTPTLLRRGRMNADFGTGMYDFHWEYPIESHGTRKDIIVVIEANGDRIPLLEWCRREQAVVACSKCGQDVTYQVAKRVCHGFWRRFAQNTPEPQGNP